MTVFPIGGQRVGIVFSVPVLDGDGNPVVSEFMERETTESVAWVDGAGFHVQTATEQEGMSVTTSEIARAFLPIADGTLPAVDDDGNPAPVAMFDADGKAIVDSDGNTVVNSGMRLRHNGLTYVMRADAVLEQDIRGRQDHVLCVCERERG